MKRIVIAAVILLTVTSGCAQETNNGSSSNAYTSYEGLSTLLKEKTQGEDFFLIDVRTKEEYAAGHIPQALLIPVNSIGDTPPQTSKDTPIIVYCRSGNRSGAAKRILEQQGYSNVFNFGGYRNWKGEFTKGMDP